MPLICTTIKVNHYDILNKIVNEKIAAYFLKYIIAMI